MRELLPYVIVGAILGLSAWFGISIGRATFAERRSSLDRWLQSITIGVLGTSCMFAAINEIVFRIVK